jgi:S1-C subfamily serine protease
VVSLGDPASMTQGDDLWIFGYPGAGLDPRKKASEVFVLPTMNVSEGKFAGVVNERDSESVHHISWIKTDAEISGGNSGGCATDDDGNYLGAPTEVHTDVRDSKNGDGGTLGHVGFIRPTNLFKQYVDMAASGWLPSDAPVDKPEAPAGDGVTVSGKVVSADTGEPVAGIVVVVFKEGVTAKKVTSAKSPASLMLTRGETDADGQFTIANRVPKGSYTVAVIGQGYKPLIEDDVLVIDDKTPSTFRAWSKIEVARCDSGADCVK